MLLLSCSFITLVHNIYVQFIQDKTVCYFVKEKISKNDTYTHHNYRNWSTKLVQIHADSNRKKRLCCKTKNKTVKNPIKKRKIL